MAGWATHNSGKRLSLKKAIHPLDPAFGEKAEVIAPAHEEFIEEEEEIPACVTRKIAGLPPQTDSELWVQVLNNDTSSIKPEEFGIVAISRDGTRSELRHNGTLVSYNQDGSIKSFRVAPQAQHDGRLGASI